MSKILNFDIILLIKDNNKQMELSMAEKISRAVIRRLPKYHRYLKDLMDKDITRISSRELSEIMGFTASQIRQDFNNFGGFGQQGYGYNVNDLYKEIARILGLVDEYKTIIIGAGNLGRALANYGNFENFGFKLQAMFDVDEKIIGAKINGLEVLHSNSLKKYIDKNHIDIAYICTNKSSAQVIAETVIASGIKAIWNFAPTDLIVPEDVVVENVHLIEDLFTLSYFLKGASK